MPSKKKKYNSRFPPGRIKKIMQTDEEVGKVAQAVPVIISRALELFVESLLTKAMEITSARNAKTLTPSHMKRCIQTENRFDFLRDLVRGVPDLVGDSDDAPGTSTAGMASPTSMDAVPGTSGELPRVPSGLTPPPAHQQRSNGLALLVEAAGSSENKSSIPLLENHLNNAPSLGHRTPVPGLSPLNLAPSSTHPFGVSPSSSAAAAVAGGVVTSSAPLPVPPLHYYSADAAAKSEPDSLDEDYDAL